MEMSIKVAGQRMQIERHWNKFTEGTQKFVKFKFNLSSDWSGLTTFAQFVQGEDTAVSVYLDENDSVYLPPEIVEGKCFLVLSGTNGTDVVATSEAIELTIDDSHLVSNAQGTEITQSLYMQLVDRFKDIVTNQSELITQSIEDWLDENVNTTTPIVDKTLAIEGAAADSKEVGTNLSQIYFNEAIDYDSTKTYKIGQIVLYNKQIYQCKVNMDSAAGTFDSTKWYGPMHLSSLIQRTAHHVPDAIVQMISSSNYQSLGISSVYDLPPNTNIRINSDITEAMIPGLPYYGKYGTFTSVSFGTIDHQSLLIYCSGKTKKEKVWYAFVRSGDNVSKNVNVNWIPLLSECSYNDKVAANNPSVLAPVIDADSVHWNRFTFIPATGGETENIRAASTDFIPVQSGSVIKYTGEVTNTGYTGRTRACAVAYYEYDDNAGFIVRHSLISTVTVNSSDVINRDISIVPKNAKYMRVTYSYLSGLSPALTFESLSDYTNAMKTFKIEVTPPVVRPHIPSQIFNINLSAANEYSDLSNYSSNNINSYGYTNAAGWENRVTINKTIVCDDVTYSAVIKLDNTSSVCALGTETSGYNSGEKPHATIVKFDFGSGKMQFMEGDYDGKSIPKDIYTGNKTMPDDGVTMTNISGSSYRLEIGRRSRCPYAKVYNMTTGQLCAEHICDEYLTQSYGSKCGVLYDYPTFGTVSGSVTFRRVSATVPTDVFAMFIGDSITQGAKVARADAWANQAAEFLGGHCLNCGRGGGVLNHVLDCIRDIVPAAKPKYVIVTIGTNQRDATREEYEQIRDAIIKTGSIPIINCISMLPNSVSAINNIILSLGVDSCRFDRATAVHNNVSEGQNPALYITGDTTHPNVDGHEAMYKCFVATVGYIKTLSGDSTGGGH